jgi:hypothetical protein
MAMARDEHEQSIDPKPVAPPADEVIRLETGARGRLRKSGLSDAPPQEAAHATATPPQERVERLEPAPRGERHTPEARPRTGNQRALAAPAVQVQEDEEEIWGRAPVAARRMPWGWFILAGLIVIGSLLWSFRGARSVARETTQVRQAEEESRAAAALAQREAEDLVERINRAVAAFTAAASIEEMIKLVRHPDRVRPLMQEYYATNPISPSRLQQLRLVPQNLSSRTNFWIAIFRSDAGENQVVVEVLADGAVKIDWETHVGYQPLDWDRYALERPEGTHDFRVHAFRDDFHTDEFRDPAQWLCLRLTAPGAEESLFGYAKRDGPTAARLLEVLAQAGGTGASILLRLTLPPDLKSPKGVVIEQLVSPYWVLLDDPEGTP